MLNTYRKQSDTTRAYIQMHISIVLWGATAILGRSIQLSEGLLVWYRIIITAASLFTYIAFTGMRFRVPVKIFWQLAGIGILLMVHWLFFYGAIKYSNVSITLSVFASTTLFTALVEPIVTPKKFNKIELLYSLVAMAGIAVIFYSDTHSYSIGIILALLAAFIGAFFNILNKDVVNKVDSDVVSFYEILAGLVGLTILLPFYIQLFQPAKLVPSHTDWILLFVLAVACTHVPLILSLNALKHLSAFTLNLSINLEPVYGIALAFIIFHENNSLNTGFFIGTTLIMLSVILHSYFEGREQVLAEVRD